MTGWSRTLDEALSKLKRNQTIPDVTGVGDDHQSEVETQSASSEVSEGFKDRPHT